MLSSVIEGANFREINQRGSLPFLLVFPGFCMQRESG